MEIDRQYFENLCRWIGEQQKDIRQPTVFWIDEISLKEGPVKFLQHVKVYIESLGAADIEISSDYSALKVYPPMKRRSA